MGKTSTDQISLDIMVYDYEKELIQRLIEKGYKSVYSEPIRVYHYELGFPQLKLPEGFSIITLEDENDVRKINDVLWKGFDHSDEPDDDLDCRLLMQSCPNFRSELTIIIKAPKGEYACFAGMWVDGVNDFAYLEPLASNPKYRKLGLATIAITELMKQTKGLGATYCFGGASEFYAKIGFETVCHRIKMSKVWSLEGRK